MFTIAFLTFALTWWFGLYLYGRYGQARLDSLSDPTKSRLKYAGLGLLTYALAVIGFTLVEEVTLESDASGLMAFVQGLIFLPAIFWLGAMVALWPESALLKLKLEGILDYLLPTAAVVILFVTGSTTLIFENTLPRGGYWLLLGAISILMLLNVIVAFMGFNQAKDKSRQALAAAAVATLFFSLGMGLILFPLSWLPSLWILIAIGGDLIALGLIVALLDAFEEGALLRPDMLRSFTMATFMAVLFGGQVGLVMANTGSTPTMLILLVSVVAMAILLATLADPFQTILDRLVFSRFPQVQQMRQTLRAAASDLAHIPAEHELLSLDEGEFARLTRQALSHLGNLPRLANSPLIDLPLIDGNLTTLEKAAQLKLILVESINQLKPPAGNGSAFATTDEWRFYNALYFPYVVGLKPYSRRAVYDDLDPVTTQALDWFQQQVPERTLYNWQKAAAELIAQDLREMVTN